MYPPGLCHAITQGAAEQLRRDERGLHAVHAGRAPPSTEVRCERASNRVKDEEEELATIAAAILEEGDQWFSPKKKQTEKDARLDPGGGTEDAGREEFEEVAGSSGL